MMPISRRALLGQLLSVPIAAALPATALEGRPLKSYVESCGRYLGVASDKAMLLQLPELQEIIVRNFNILTPESSLKWEGLRPDKDSYRFVDSDWIVGFCHGNRMAVHGHNLCWSTQVPTWVDLSINKYNARHLLTNHISTVMRRYAGKIVSWDVVNEPMALLPKRPDGLAEGAWLNNLGPEYIDIAFQTALESDPTALRVLNIAYVEHTGPDIAVRSNTLALLRALVKRGVPIQAVGIESHIDAARQLGGDDFHRFLVEIRQLGLQILITELDVSDLNVIGDTKTVDGAVARRYTEYLNAVGTVTDTQQLIFWVLSDYKNWQDWLATIKPQDRRKDGKLHRPGLLDTAMQEKPSWAAVQTYLSSKHC